MYFYDVSSIILITNNIICHNSSGGGIYSMYANCVISYNNVYGNMGGDYQGWAWPGEGDISVDPCFVDGDYHLKSEAGHWDSNSQTWVVDSVTSPCIDAGDPSADWTAELWPHGKRINMGACGGTPEASMSVLTVGNIADLNNDGFVDYADMMVFVSKWLNQHLFLREDLGRNGIVNFLDFAIFADNWLWKE